MRILEDAVSREYSFCCAPLMSHAVFQKIVGIASIREIFSGRVFIVETC